MISYTTFQDSIDLGLDYLGSNASDSARRDVIRAILETYRDLANAFNWSYLYTHGRINTSPAYDGSLTSATVTYTQAGGTYPQMLTLSGDTWPAWAGDGAYIRLTQGTDPTVDNVTDAVAYRIAERKSATVLTLTDSLNPGEDLAPGTTFILYRDTYILPDDYIAQDQANFERNFGGMTFTHPREWLYENRYVFAQGVPTAYTITGDPQYPGRLVMRIFPWPYEAKTIDFIYKRRPGHLAIANYSTGTVSVTAGINTVTGVGTTFTPSMVGSVIRLSGGGTKPPTSLIMNTVPTVFESFVTAYVSPTSLQIGDPADASYAAVPFAISDMIDVEQGAMLNAFNRGVEKHIGMNRTLKDKPSAKLQYDTALGEAKAADSRSFTGRSVGDKSTIRRRLRDYPYTFNIT
jgi:hypothetical protein